MRQLNTHIMSELDIMEFWFDTTCQQLSRASFPQADFARRGITSMTNIECTERSGALFLLGMLTMHHFGWNLFDGSSADTASVLSTTECLLYFEAWLDQDTYQAPPERL